MGKIFELKKKQNYRDIDIVIGIQNRNRIVESCFYKSAKTYFMSKYNDVFFDQDQKEEIFQDSFIRLWTQVENGTIREIDGRVCRIGKDGQYKSMTCSLNTFLISIAKNEYREIVRSTKEVFVEDYYGICECELTVSDDDITELKIKIVDDCIQSMAPRCLEILTLSYIEGKSLDEIMEIRKDKNTSKVGLKSAKHKCMIALREKVTEQFSKLSINI